VLKHPLDEVVLLRGGVLRWPELGAERKGGRGGEWETGREQRHAAARRGASAAVGWHGMAGSGPTAVLVGGARTGYTQPVSK
jgi:hypothetical protein